MVNKFEFGYESDNTYYIRHMTDGRVTLVQLMVRTSANPVLGTVVAQGVSRRHKGDARNPDYGSSLAFERMHLQAAQYYRALCEESLSGTKSEAMIEIEEKVLAQIRKAEQKKHKDARRAGARDRWLRQNRDSKFARFLLGKRNAE